MMPVPVPAEALKRFAEELKVDLVGGGRFLKDNMERVDGFINKPNKVELPKLTGKELAAFQEKERVQSEKNEAARRNARTKGLYSYPKNEQKTGISELQDRPEFSTALGPRSRFGEGDGGYFDRWLNTDERISSFRRPGDDLVKMAGDVHPPFSGFKHHVSHLENPRKLEYVAVKPYAQRRKERLLREGGASLSAEERAELEDPSGAVSSHSRSADGRFVQDGSGLSSPQAPRAPATQQREGGDPDLNENGNGVQRTAAAPYLTLPELSQEDAEIYFGPKARTAFFDFYKQMSAMRAMSVSGNTLDLMARGTADTDEEDEGQQEKLTAAERRHGTKSRRTQGEGKNRGAVIDDGMKELQEFQKAYEPTGAEPPPDTAAMDKTHFALPLIKKDDGVSEVMPGFFRPASARSRFISACVENNVGPRPALVMRSGVTSTLSLRGQYMGDAIAQNLAIALEVMPYLQNLDLSSNSLTDRGLCTIMQSLPVCSTLASVDFSDNNIGIDGIDALAELLLNEECNVAKLVLKQCNIVDSVLKDFLEVIGVKTNLRHLDLSRNNIGRPENLALHGDESPGVLALAALLAHPSCIIEVLNISWNAISRSFPVLVDAIRKNPSLTTLDLSYNGLGDHGEALGAALADNHALTSLDVSHNKMKARATFTLVSAVYACKTLQFIELSGNPVGKVGAAAIIKLQSRLGRHVSVSMEGCSVSMRDPAAAPALGSQSPIGNYTLDLAVPYERALCNELTRVVAEDERLLYKSFTLDGGESLEFERLSAPVEARNRIAVEENAAAADEVGKEEKEIATLETPPGNRHEEIDIDAAAAEFLRSGSSTMNAADLHALFARISLVEDVATREQESKKHAQDILRLYDVDRSGDIEVAEFRSYLHNVRSRRNTKHANSLVCGADIFHYLTLAGGKKKEPFAVPAEGIASITVGASFVQSEHKQISTMENILKLVSSVRTSSESTEILKIAVESMCLQYEEACVLYRMLTKEDGDKVGALTTLLPVMHSPISARTLIAHAGLSSLNEVCQLKKSVGPMMYRVHTGAFNGYYFLDLARAEDRLCLVRLMEASAFAQKHRNDSNLGDTSERGDWSSFRNVIFEGEEFNMKSKENVALAWGDVLPSEGIMHFDFAYAVDEASGNPDNAAIVSSEKLFNLLLSLGCIGPEMVNKDAFLQAVQHLEELGKAHAPDATDAESAHERYTTMRGLLSSENLKARTSKASAKAESALHSISAEELDMAAAGKRFVQRKKHEEERKTRPGTADHSDAPVDELPQILVQSELLQNLRHHVEDLEHYAADHPQDSTVDLLLATRRADVLQHSLCCRMLTCAQLALILKTFPNGYLCPRVADAGTGGYTSTTASTATLALDDGGTGSVLSPKEYSTLRVGILVDAFHQIVDRWHFGLVLVNLSSVEVGMILTRLGLLNVLTAVSPPAALRLDMSKQDQKQYLRVLMAINGVEKSWGGGVVYATAAEAAEEAAEALAKEVAEAEKVAAEAAASAAATGSTNSAESTDVPAPVSPKKDKKDKKDTEASEPEPEPEEEKHNKSPAAAHPPPSEWMSESAIPSDGVVTLLLPPPADVHLSKNVREVLMGCCLSCNRHGSGAKKPSVEGADKIAQLEHLEISFVHEKRLELLHA